MRTPLRVLLGATPLVILCVILAAQRDGAGRASAADIQPAAEDSAVEQEAAGDEATEGKETDKEQPGEEQMAEDEKEEDKEEKKEAEGEEQEGAPPEEEVVEEKEAAEESTAQAADVVDAAAEPLAEEYSCIFCHSDAETFSDDTKHLLVVQKDLESDIHWKKGLRCHDCHGGSPDLETFKDHRKDPSFRTLQSPSDIPRFCGDCHSDIEYMRQYDPSPRTDQLSEYWTSGHGQALKATEDPKVATCVSCHGRHGIRAVDDLESPVFPTNLAKTCAVCHSDVDAMAGRQYHGRPLGHDQYILWKKSVHARALLEKGDLSAPTCNDCHGNHGAVPPEVDSVANACGTCHVKVAELFAKTRMKHRFEEVNLPGCATCHGNHEIHHPTDEMLGMDITGVCADCHEERKYGATLAGADEARKMRKDLEQLKQQIAKAEAKLNEAERLGMPVHKPRFELREARDALTNARSLVHSFALEPMKEVLDRGLEVGRKSQQDAQEQLREYTLRRIWLALSLVPILTVVGVLVLYIRTLPASSP